LDCFAGRRGKKDPAELAAVIALKDSWGEKLDIVKVMNSFNALHSVVTNDAPIRVIAHIL
jgi:hypothetical protein